MRRVALLAIAFGAIPSCKASLGASGPTAPIELANDQVSVTVDVLPFGVTVRNKRGDVLARSYGGRATGDDPNVYANLAVTHRQVAFASHLLDGWDYQTPTYDPYVDATRVTREEHTPTSATLDVEQGATTGTIAIALTGTEVLVTAEIGGTWNDTPDDLAPPGPNIVSMAFALPEDEHFFGLGERLVTVDHRGRHYESWVEEGGIGQGEHAPPGPGNPSPNGPQMTHKPVPFFLSNKGYGMWIETTYRTGTSFGAEQPDAWRLYANEGTLKLHVFVHDDPKDTIADFTAKTGRAHMPAEWAFGPRMRLDVGNMIDGVPEMHALRDHGVPCTGADDAIHFLPIGAYLGREAELEKWTGDLHALGYKALGYYNAYISTTDARMAADLAEARSGGFLVKLDDGTESNTVMISAGAQTVATFDMTNPGAVAFYQKLLQRALDLGYDGWMLDFGEYLPPNAKMSDGRMGWEAHNLFPILYQKATTDYLERVRPGDYMFFSRAGYTGTQASTSIVWSGDPSSSFDDAKGLPAQVRAGINAGISAIPFWGSDVSGYTCQNDPPADKEVFLRWAAFGALSPIMEVENACAGSLSGPKWNVWSDAETTKLYGDYARLHTRLFPYLYAAAKVATMTGLSIMRHPFLLHPTSPEAYAVEHDYYFGPSLYATPVVRRGATTRDMWLPPGRWVDWTTLDPLPSGKVTRNAPLDWLPLFLKSGGVVPLLDPSVQTLSRSATDPAVVTLDTVKDVLDVRSAIDVAAKHGEITLTDGSVLGVTLDVGAVALPSDVPAAAAEADLATCASCGRIDALPSGVQRVRISTSAESVKAGSLSLTRAGGVERLRWDVAVLP